MSKFKECLSKISHYKNNEQLLELETSMYVFAEAQSTGSHTFYDHSIWEWKDKKIKIHEVGIHPDNV